MSEAYARGVRNQESSITDLPDQLDRGRHGHVTSEMCTECLRTATFSKVVLEGKRLIKLFPEHIHGCIRPIQLCSEFF